ncbi:MAG: hypothetical protein AB7I38_07540 [Dehalococcoidia bacterium]
MHSQPCRRRLIALALLLFVTTLLACGDNPRASTGAPTPFFTPRAATTAARTPPGATATESTSPAPASSTAPASPTAGGGTLTLAGNSYAFTVRTCHGISGQYYLVGDGDANVALASVLIIQTDGRGSFIVDEPDAASAGTTLTVSGMARNLVLPGDQVDVTLAATCPGLAD